MAEPDTDTEHRNKMVEALITSGDVFIVMLNAIRALLAVAIIGVTCYREATGQTVSDSFAMLVGLVVGMYFEKGTASLGIRTGIEPKGSREQS